MVNIRILSDVHNEFSLMDVPVIENEQDIVLVLAGDIGVAKQPATYVDFVRDLAKRHKHVVYVLGNHEYYKGSYNRTFDKINENIGEIENLSIFEKGLVEIDGVVFVVATLWTDMDKQNPITMFNAKKLMNDYRKIRIGSTNDPYKRKFEPLDVIGLHANHKKFMFESINQAKQEGKKVVCVSHHAPSEFSVPEKFKGDIINGAYYSNLEYDILDAKPDVWIHGHTHDVFDYMLEDTRIICNPRGYSSIGETTGFDPMYVIEI